MIKIFSIPDLSLKTLRVFYRNLIVFKKTWKTNIAFNFIEPLLYLAAMGYGLGTFVKEMEGISYIHFIAPGIIASSAMWASAAECTYDAFVRMKFQKTFHAIAVTPVTLDEVVVGEMIFGVFKSVLYGTVILAVIASLGLAASIWALLIPIILILNGLVFSELGMIWTGLVPKIDSFSYFFTLVITPMFLFSGIFFPVSSLPYWSQILSWFTPLYHVVELVRAFALGNVDSSLWKDFVWLIFFCIIFFNPPINLVKRRLIK